MAAPIYQPGRTHRAVYLPAGTWFDWWTGERIVGPTHVLAHAPLERMPLYVQGGAIIPGGPDMEYTDQHPLNPLTLDLYPGNGSFTLYEDDGRTVAYQQGQFCTTDIVLGLDAASGRLSLTIGARAGAYSPPARQIVVRLHDASPSASQEHAGAAYDADQRLLTLTLDDDDTERTLAFQVNT
jgi:alpha-glucosidase